MKTISRFALAALAAAALMAGKASADIVDLTTSSSGVVHTIYGDAIFTTNFLQPAGTGVFDPFLTIQAKGTEQGYNTSKGVFDTKREPQWNHEIRLSDLAKVTIEGVQYYSFLIDINEPNSSATSTISLDALKIFTSTKAGQTTANVENLGVKRFDLDLPSDSYIKYNDLNSGSGQADIAFFIPTSAFIGASASDYVYMYQLFGAHISASENFDGTTQGGFEETRIGVAVPVPEVSTFVPLTSVLFGVIGVGYIRRRRSAA